MKSLEDFKEDIHKCSRCGLCQAVCPIFKATGNDCTVSRGQFVMLNGLIKGDLKMTKMLNRYLELCLKCSACSKFCPSGIDVVDVIAAAKSKYFEKNSYEKLISFIQKNILFGILLNFAKFFNQNTKSKKFDKKVLYYGGCGSKARGDKTVVKILNSIGIEVINPNFSCCGMPFFTRGDFDNFGKYIQKFVNIVKKYNIDEIVTTCATCEKTIKDYKKWCDNKENLEILNKLKIKNIYNYICENEYKLTLKKSFNVTYHKPCNLNNYNDIEWILNNTENLNYVKSDNYDECCGLNGLTNIKEIRTLKNVYKAKRDGILKTGEKLVLTSCLGCEATLSLYSFGAYKVMDLAEFLSKNLL